jgi:hypothetical protein
VNDFVVQIVGPTDSWILEKSARILAAKIPYATFVPWKPQPTSSTRIAYYVNYALYQKPSGLIDVGFFTHLDQSHQFLERARQIDLCISMSQLYADWLKAGGVNHVVHIPTGFDSYRYRPRLVLGVVGLLDHPRKGRNLVDHLRRLPFVQIRTTEGRVAEADMREFYEQVDFVLIPATVEGGPMSLLEGLGLGKPVIAPEGVGMVQEFAESKHIRRYPKGDAAALEQVVRTCYAEKLECANLVSGRTMDDWAESHHHCFMNLLKSRGLPTPTAAPGFRFGMLKELDLPWNVDLAPLESAIDRAAAHLFFGRYPESVDILAEAAETYPCLDTLLNSISRYPRSSLPHRAFPPVAPPTIHPPNAAVTINSGSERAPQLLLIAHIGTLRDRMDKSHYLRYEALARRPGVKLIGPGVPGYRKEMTVDEAIQVTFGTHRPDLIIHGGDLRDSGIPLVSGLNETGLPTAIELLDTWANPDRTLNFINRYRFDLGLIQEAGPHLEFYRRHCPQTQFIWTPNGVDLSRFRDYGLQKEYDLILYGVLEPNIYPFRTRLTRLLANRSDFRVKFINHPGYYPNQQPTVHPVVSGADLAREINKSWIGIATRSAYNCLLMKYLEIAASGAAIAGNLPDSGRELFDGCVIELGEEMSDETIISRLHEALSDKNRLTRMIEISSQRVARGFSTEAFADRVMSVCEQARRLKSRCGKTERGVPGV